MVRPSSFPLRFLPDECNKANTEIVELNYIVIEHPLLAAEEETYSEEAGGEISIEQKGDISPLAEKEMPVSLEIKEGEYGQRGEKGDQETAFLKYFNIIREKIRAEIHSILGRGEKGTVKVVFTLDPNGCLRKINSISSDSTPSIRQKTLRGMKKASPFPPFPGEMGSGPVKFSLTIRFAAE